MKAERISQRKAPSKKKIRKNPLNFYDSTYFQAQPPRINNLANPLSFSRASPRKKNSQTIPTCVVKLTWETPAVQDSVKLRAISPELSSLPSSSPSSSLSGGPRRQQHHDFTTGGKVFPFILFIIITGDSRGG